MPKLWNQTIEEHRRDVREAILDATAALVAERGLRAVGMSQIAEKTGIGRATLYKYFPDVETILVAWHERQIRGHLDQLGELGHRGGTPIERLETVLEAYALMTQEHQGTELAALLHGGEHVARAHEHLQEFVRRLIADGAKSGHFRKDIAPGELATFCLHALTAVGSLKSKAAVGRLVQVTLSGLRPSR